MDVATKPNLRQAVPFFAVSDMSASLRFYEEGLGFRIGPKWKVEDELRWCWLERDGVSLMLQHFLVEGGDSWRPSGKCGEGVRICILCDDALSLFREARDRGLEPQRPYVGNGLWVTSLTDPDGYALDFESPADAPEDTEYSET
jgi:catechol 2,3-dioxygenase-like lactoylglutathione lyase family enzyme